MNSDQTEKILCLHRDCGIALQHSVALLFRVQGMSLSAVAKAAGYQRTYLYKALAGELEPSPRLRRALEDALGVDPWAVHEAAGSGRPDDAG